MNAKDGVTLALIGAAGFVAYKLFGFVGGAAKEGLKYLNTAGEALGSKLFDLFHPNAVGESLYYTVTFPNGARHAIPSGAVDSAGQFDYVQPPLAARRYQLLTGKDGLRYAAPVK